MDGRLKTALSTGEWIEGDIKKEYDEAILRCALKIQRYNTEAMSSVKEIQTAFSDITDRKIDETSIVVFPFRCDLGFNVIIGRDVIVNYNCTFLDTAPITVGDHTKIGPGCSLVTADHPCDYMERREHKVRGLPITVGSDCWLGANVTVLPGVTIGDRSIIGAGSVVTHDVPADSVYAGNPAHPIE